MRRRVMMAARVAGISSALVLAGMPLALAQSAGGTSLPLAAFPLKEGRYSAGGCDRFNEADGYIGVGVHKDGPHKGKHFLVPQAERQQGFCTVQKLAPMGAVLSGTAECDSGARTNPAPMGTYRFNYAVHDPMSSTSLGKRYGWCPARR